MRSILLALVLFVVPAVAGGPPWFDRSAAPLWFEVWVFDTAPASLKRFGLAQSPVVGLATRPPLKPHWFFMTEGNTKCLARERLTLQSGERARCRLGDKSPVTWFDPVSAEFRSDDIESQALELELSAALVEGGALQVKVQSRLGLITQLVSGQYPVVESREYEAGLNLREDGDSLLVNLAPLVDEDLLTQTSPLPQLEEGARLGRYFVHSNPRLRKAMFVLITAHFGYPSSIL